MKVWENAKKKLWKHSPVAHVPRISFSPKLPLIFLQVDRNTVHVFCFLNNAVLISYKSTGSCVLKAPLFPGWNERGETLVGSQVKCFFDNNIIENIMSGGSSLIRQFVTWSFQRIQGIALQPPLPAMFKNNFEAIDHMVTMLLPSYPLDIWKV